MTNGYLPIIVLTLLAGAFAVFSLLASRLLRPKRSMAPKEAPYESGVVPVRLPRFQRFPVKFYVVAMLFIIFDIETIFLFPWAVAFRSLGIFGLVEMLIFIGLVFVAYVYVWQKGGLEWDTVERRAVGPGEARPESMPSSVELGPGEVVETATAAGPKSAAMTSSPAPQEVGARRA